jgi:CRP-like cAMP-binding protein
MTEGICVSHLSCPRAVFTLTPASASTVIAVRDTELAKIPAEAVAFVKQRFPQTLTHLMSTLGRRMLSSFSNNACAFARLLCLLGACLC